MKTSSSILHLTVGEPADELLAKAQRVSRLKEKAVLVQEGLKALIERERARHLARLGGTEPQLQPVTRHQSEPV